MKQVLIVDDEKPFLLSVQQGLKTRLKKTTILTAENGVEALALLKLTPVDLLVTDLKMPVMDGFELLSHLSQEYTELPVIVMTALGSPEVEDRLQQLGSVRCLEKPLDLSTLSNTIQQSLDSRASGFVQGITLPTFAQLMEMEKKSCVLEVRSEGKQGRLYFNGGALIHACFDDLTGETAALEVFAWTDVAIEMDAVEAPEKRTIHTPLTHLIMEALRLKDEQDWAEQEQRTVGDPHEDLLASDATFALLGPDASAVSEVPLSNWAPKLEELSELDGFASAGLFTSEGKTVEVLEADGEKPLSPLAEVIQRLMHHAQQMSSGIDAGSGHLVHVEAEQAHILIRTLPITPTPLQLVMVLQPGTSIGMAKLRLSKIVQGVLVPENA